MESAYSDYMYFYVQLQKDEKALRPLKHKQQQQKSHLFLLPRMWIMSYNVSFEISCGDLLGPSWLITAR